MNLIHGILCRCVFHLHPAEEGGKRVKGEGVHMETSGSESLVVR